MLLEKDKTMKQLLILVILFLLVPALVLAEEPVRTWTTVSGKTLSAVWMTDSDVGEGRIRLRSGSQFSAPQKGRSKTIRFRKIKKETGKSQAAVLQCSRFWSIQQASAAGRGFCF